jgi:hypothetical protein
MVKALEQSGDLAVQEGLCINLCSPVFFNCEQCRATDTGKTYSLLTLRTLQARGLNPYKPSKE